jgi:hypothetical protein
LCPSSKREDRPAASMIAPSLTSPLPRAVAAAR